MISPASRKQPRQLHPTTLAIGLLAIVLATGCSGGAVEEVSAPPPPSNPDLNLAFSAIPSGFEVVQNDAEAMRLAPTDPEDASVFWVEVGEASDFGIPITEIVTAQKELFEALPDGDFGGNNELMTLHGRAFYSRGRYTHEGAQVEETRVFQIHPTENRLITFHYRYPAGDDSAERVQQLLFWLGELEVPTVTEPDPASEQAEPSA